MGWVHLALRLFYVFLLGVSPLIWSETSTAWGECKLTLHFACSACTNLHVCSDFGWNINRNGLVQAHLALGVIYLHVLTGSFFNCVAEIYDRNLWVQACTGLDFYFFDLLFTLHFSTSALFTLHFLIFSWWSICLFSLHFWHGLVFWVLSLLTCSRLSM